MGRPRKRLCPKCGQTLYWDLLLKKIRCSSIKCNYEEKGVYYNVGKRN